MEYEMDDEMDDDGPDLAYREVVRRLIRGELPRGEQFDACRAVLINGSGSDTNFQAMCLLLEGALADPSLAIDDTQVVVRLLKELASGTLLPEEVM